MSNVGLKAAEKHPRGLIAGYGISTLVLVAAAHGLNDLYTAFLPPLLPAIIQKFGLSYTAAGFLQSTLSLSTSLAQPLFGYAADRTGRVPFIALGPLVTAVALSLVGAAPSYGLLMVLLVIGGVSTALFHPQASSVIPQLAHSRAGMAMAVFIAGGTFGYAVGPFYAYSVSS